MKLLTRAARPPFAHLPFFAGWTAAELHRLSRFVETVDYEPGDVLAAGNLPAREFIVIACGHVDLVDGRRRLARLGEGDTIGAEGLLAGSISRGAAVAQTYVRALVLGPREFNGLLWEAPSMGRHLSRLLAERLSSEPAA